MFTIILMIFNGFWLVRIEFKITIGKFHQGGWVGSSCNFPPKGSINGVENTDRWHSLIKISNLCRNINICFNSGEQITFIEFKQRSFNTRFRTEKKSRNVMLTLFLTGLLTKIKIGPDRAIFLSETKFAQNMKKKSKLK